MKPFEWQSVDGRIKRGTLSAEGSMGDFTVRDREIRGERDFSARERLDSQFDDCIFF